MRRRRIALAAAACLMLAVISGCGGADKDMRVITDLKGKEIKVPERAERIAAVYGPSYEALALLGAEDRIVVCADVQVDNFPWAQKIFKRMNELPYLENVHTAVNVETLISYKPDLVFGFPRPNEERKLAEAKVSSVPGATTLKLSDIKDQLMVYAEALGGDAVEAARQYAAYFDERLKMVTDITDAIPESERPSVYYAGIDLLTTYGKKSDLPELVHAAGGRAVTADLDAGSRTQINFEQLAVYNPDYIFIDHGGMNDKETAEAIMQNAYSDGRYSLIQAVADKRVYLSPSGVFYWDMGLQKILLLMNMAQILHPDKFADLDMAGELQQFYTRFFHYDLTAEEAAKILNRENP